MKENQRKNNKAITLIAPITFTKEQLNKLIQKNFQKSMWKKSSKNFHKSICLKKVCNLKEERV